MGVPEGGGQVGLVRGGAAGVVGEAQGGADVVDAAEVVADVAAQDVNEAFVAGFAAADVGQVAEMAAGGGVAGGGGLQCRGEVLGVAGGAFVPVEGEVEGGVGRQGVEQGFDAGEAVELAGEGGDLLACVDDAGGGGATEVAGVMRMMLWETMSSSMPSEARSSRSART
ncbi:hypothetical protein ACFQ3Z_00115 [Streptomyces nogalater]